MQSKELQDSKPVVNNAMPIDISNTVQDDVNNTVPTDVNNTVSIDVNNTLTIVKDEVCDESDSRPKCNANSTEILNENSYIT